MTTPALGYTGEVCVDFFYHMRGVEIGNLTVYLQQGDTYTDSDAARVQFTRGGEQGTAAEPWLRARITVNLLNQQDRVRIHFSFNCKKESNIFHVFRLVFWEGKVQTIAVTLLSMKL